MELTKTIETKITDDDAARQLRSLLAQRDRIDAQIAELKTFASGQGLDVESHAARQIAAEAAKAAEDKAKAEAAAKEAADALAAQLRARAEATAEAAKAK